MPRICYGSVAVEFVCVCLSHGLCLDDEVMVVQKSLEKLQKKALEFDLHNGLNSIISIIIN